MTNDELAAEIDRRCAVLAGLIAEAEKAGARRYIREAEMASQIGFVAFDNLPAILTALRTPGPAVGEDAVERVMAVVENAFIIGVRLAHGRSHVGEQWLINNNWGRYRERLMPQARAALAAMPGVGVAEGRVAELVEFDSGQTIQPGHAVIESMGWSEDEPSRFTAKLRFPNGAPDLPINVVWKAIPVRLVALSATPPPAAESHAGEVHPDFRELMDAAWAINDKLRITPGMEAIFTGSTNDIDRFRDLLHDLEPAYRTAQEPAAGERGDRR